MTTNYIYLIHLREFIYTGKNIYKIGKTKKELFSRIYQYPKGSVLITYSLCIDCNKMERQIINIFKSKFILQKIVGNEYFEGNVGEMIDIINNCIKKERDNNTLNNYIISYNYKFNTLLNHNANIENVNDDVNYNDFENDNEYDNIKCYFGIKGKF